MHKDQFLLLSILCWRCSTEEIDVIVESSGTSWKIVIIVTNVSNVLCMNGQEAFAFKKNIGL